MSYIDDYMRHIERDLLPLLHEQLKPLEAGELLTGERKGYGPWFDTTDRDFWRLKQAIAEYEAILAEYRSKKVI
jgi:hypothetical protein